MSESSPFVEPVGPSQVERLQVVVSALEAAPIDAGLAVAALQLP